MQYIKNDSAKFVNELEEVGIVIKNKKDLLGRLIEISNWQNGFVTLVKYGERLRIKFEASSALLKDIYSVLVKYGIDEILALECSQKICVVPTNIK
jgi:hypothetical protein